MLPALADWRLQPLNVRLAVQTMCEIDNLAEHFIQYQNPGIDRKALGAARDRLAGAVPALGIARDIHDTHKHGALWRRGAKITAGQRPIPISSGSLLGNASIGSALLGGSTTELEVTLDDGTMRNVPILIDNYLAYWEAELARAGL